jgi:hypothetical protein
MCHIAPLNVVQQKRRRDAFLLTPFLLMAFSQFMFGQNPQSDACHMDSSGFCINEDVPNPPLWVASPQSAPSPELRSTPQSNTTAAAISAAKPKLEVQFRNGLLRIVAEYISLRDILIAVSGQTGAEVQFPVGALGDRVFVHLGPATPQEVVTQLLKGSDFNYVILSSNTEPGGIARLILTRAASAGHEGSPSSAVLSNNATTPQLYGAGFSTDADSAAADLAPSPEQPPAVPTASWIHHDGAELSGEQLDQMQKAAIQQEQQQFAQQLQQRQQQEQASHDTAQQ